MQPNAPAVQPHLSHEEHILAFARVSKLNEAQGAAVREVWEAYQPSFHTHPPTSVAHPTEPIQVVQRNMASMHVPVDDAFIVNWLVMYGPERPIPPFEERAQYVDQLLLDLKQRYPHDYLNPITPGIYKHYKGDLYVVVGTAVNRESDGSVGEPIVVFHALGDPNTLWWRTMSEFEAIINLVEEDRTVPRFTPQPNDKD